MPLERWSKLGQFVSLGRSWHYNLNETIFVSTITGRTTIRPPTGPCSFAYTILRNTNSNNGVIMPANATTIRTCRNHCDAMGLICAGFDYDANQVPNRCYSHTMVTIQTRNYGLREGITQYIKDGGCFYQSSETRNGLYSSRFLKEYLTYKACNVDRARSQSSLLSLTN